MYVPGMTEFRIHGSDTDWFIPAELSGSISEGDPQYSQMPAPSESLGILAEVEGDTSDRAGNSAKLMDLTLDTMGAQFEGAPYMAHQVVMQTQMESGSGPYLPTPDRDPLISAKISTVPVQSGTPLIPDEDIYVVTYSMVHSLDDALPGEKGEAAMRQLIAAAGEDVKAHEDEIMDAYSRFMEEKPRWGFAKSTGTPVSIIRGSRSGRSTTSSTPR